MKKPIKLSIFAAALLSTNILAQDLTPPQVDSNSSYLNSITDNLGNIYTVWQDGGDSDKRGRIFKYNGSSWVQVDSYVNNDPDYINAGGLAFRENALAVDSKNKLHVLYIDYASEYDESTLSYLRYNPNSNDYEGWESQAGDLGIEGKGIFSDGLDGNSKYTPLASDFALDINSSDIPIAAYIDTNDNNGIKVRYLNDNGTPGTDSNSTNFGDDTWDSLGTVGRGSTEIDMVIDDDIPYLAYTEETGGRVSVLKYINGSWDMFDANISEGNATNIDIYVADDENIYLSYVDNATTPVVAKLRRYIPLSQDEESTDPITMVTSTDIANVSYSLAGDDKELFSISNDGNLGFTNAISYENNQDSNSDGIYEVTVVLTDPDSNLSVERHFNISLNDINDAPVISSYDGNSTANVNISENIASITTLSSSEQDSGDSVTYSISGGADSSLFDINSTTGVLSFKTAPNYESPSDSGSDNTYEVEISATDTNNASDTQTITVTIDNNASEAPSVTLSINSSVIAEDNGASTITALLSEAVSEDTNITIGNKSTSTANLADDFSLSSTTIIIAAGSTSNSATLTGIDDKIDDDNETATIEITMVSGGESASEDGIQEKTITITDDDTAGVTLSKSSISVDENGTTESFSVKLDTRPTDDVVIDISSNDNTEVSLNPSSLSFTTNDWNTSKTVTVTGVDDDMVDGDINSTVTLSINTVSTLDTVYDAVSDENVTVVTNDDDSAGFTLSKTTASVDENGSTDTFAVVLDKAPVSGSVVFNISSNDTGEVTVNPSSLSFTSANYNTPQTITLTGVDDSDTDGNINSKITIIVDAAGSNDSFDALAEQNVTVTTVDDDNIAPTVSNSSISVNEDIPHSFTQNSFTGYFSDADNDTLAKIKITTLPVNGTLSLNDVNISLNDEINISDIPNMKYLSDTDYNGNDSFSWKGFDSIVYSQDPADVNITVNAQNDTPTLNPISNITKDEDFSTFNVTITPSDIDSDNLKLTVDMNDSGIISIPANSTDWITNANYSSGLALQVSPIANKYGTTELNVTVEDPSGERSSEIFTITVNSVDDAPVASNMAATVGPNSKNTFDKFTPSFSDAENHNPVMLKIESLPAIGTFETNTSDNNWTQITSVPFEVPMNALVNYRYNAGDNNGLSTDVNWSVMTSIDESYANGLWSNTATGVVTIIDPDSNNAPDVNISTNEDNNISGKTISVDEDGVSNTVYVTFSDDYTPSAFLVGVIDSNDTGKVSLNDGDFNITRLSDNNVSVVITPKANVYGDVNITLGAFDGDKNGTRSFTLHINPVNDNPSAFNFEKTIDEDNIYSFSSLDPTSVYNDTNDSSQDSNEAYPDIFNIVSLPQHGQLDLNDSAEPLIADTNISLANLSSLVYRPEENNFNDINFTWKAYDGEAWTDIKTATIHITPVDDAPTLDSITTQNMTEDGEPINVILSSNDAEGDSISYSVTSSNTDVATVSLNDNNITITPAANANGSVTIEVNATANGQSAIQSFDVDIESVNDTPSIDSTLDDISILEDSGETNIELNVSDIEGDELNITLYSSDSTILKVSPNWVNTLSQSSYNGIALDFNITTIADKNGMVTITVNVTDENNASAYTSFDVNVTPINDAPVIQNISDKIVYKNFSDINITMPKTDIDNDILEYNATTKDKLFNLEVNSNIITISSIEGLSGSSDINLSVSDGEYNDSTTFNLKILSLGDGDSITQGEVNQSTDENGTTTTTISLPDDNLTLQTKEDTNGTVSHEIAVGGKTTKASSDINGSKVEVTDNGVHTYYEDTNSSIKAEVNATITGEAVHTLEVNGTKVTATSEVSGAQTVITKDSNGSIEVITTVEIEESNGTVDVEITAKADGSAEHKVTTNGKTSTATSKIKGAKTTVKADSHNVETSAGEIDEGTYYIKALVVTKPNGETETRFVKVDKSTDEVVEIIGNTVKESTPFEPGNEASIEEIGGDLFIKAVAPLSKDLEIE